MGINDLTGEIDYSVTNSTFERQGDGGVRITANVEGTATGYGRVAGTITLASIAPTAQSGPVAFTGVGFLDSGELLHAQAAGYWRKTAGQQKWRIFGVNLTSAGNVVVTDAMLDLVARTYRGSLGEWT